jgi:hypothetical protein
MPKKLTDTEIAEIQGRYRHLINYKSVDPCAPIDPLSYEDSNGDRLLHIAARAGDLGTVELLVCAGQDVDQRGDMGCTALHCANMRKANGVIAFLLANGADRNLINEFGQRSGEAAESPGPVG